MPIKSCSNCGYTRFTNPHADLCQACETARRREHYDKEFRSKLDELGFNFVSYVKNIGIHSKVTVTNRSCGHTFTSKLDNILNGFTVCGVCGPKKRTKNASLAYVAKYGRTYDITKWKEYLKQVWILSNRAYLENKAILNPQDLPRRKAHAHPQAVNLDHIVPVIYGFKNGLPPELIADLRNLRIVDAVRNLSKKQKLTLEAKQLLADLRCFYRTDEIFPGNRVTEPAVDRDSMAALHT